MRVVINDASEKKDNWQMPVVVRLYLVHSGILLATAANAHLRLATASRRLLQGAAPKRICDVCHNGGNWRPCMAKRIREGSCCRICRRVLLRHACDCCGLRHVWLDFLGILTHNDVS